MAPPNLLDLPPEIRNYIYEYALVSETGSLFYRDPQEMELPPEETEARVTKRENTGTKILFAYYKAPSVSRIHLCETGESHTEMNQLKYVCRQLHHETKRLEMRYNNLVCQEDAICPLPADIQLARCLHICDHAWLSKIRTIILKSTKSHGDSATLPVPSQIPKIRHQVDFEAYPVKFITDFCVANPKITIKYYRSELRQITWRGFWAGLLVGHLSTGRQMPINLYGTKHLQTYQRRVAGKNGMIGSRGTLVQCPNLRMFPHDEAFDEAKFRAGAVADANMRSEILPFIAGGLDTCVKEVKRIFLEGF
ncbi:hypothetical protein IAQ61_010087 [Plenodomus lingam]|nr:hypothetical protein IAQ61_010087 [Plenodomus lingam]